jgi:hypothetical protein
MHKMLYCAESSKGLHCHDQIIRENDCGAITHSDRKESKASFFVMFGRTIGLHGILSVDGLLKD